MQRAWAGVDAKNQRTRSGDGPELKQNGMQVTGEPRDVRDLSVAHRAGEKARRQVAGADTSGGSGQSTGVFILRGQRLARSDAGAYQCGKDPQPDFPDTAVHRLA